MSAWLTRHAQTSIGSLGRLSQHKLATLLTVLVIGIALALPACLHLLISNAQTATGNWNRAVELTVFLKRPTSAEEASRTADRVRQRRDVSEVQLITSADALKGFRRDSGFGAAIDALNENPLPHTLVITPAAEFSTSANLDSLAADLRAMPSIEVVQLDTAWVNRLNAILDTVRRGLVVAAALLALGVMVIVGNTIRLDIQNRRAEIEVTKLVGGSDAFVRRPFLYNGIWYGLGGGVTAWIITLAVIGILREPIGRLAGLYGSAFQLGGLDPRATLILLGSGVVLGWLGSYLAASRHLRAIEPT
ncbi:permease-like cell division protein FtsX [Steroidobacter sp.]|uniref:permease-like cell division protein FtsX n=1 Tax=Steroidobacter sp. TaxID=1978227 RepID=UPI001A613BA0|nr:permease-like cell division protein FtsX [Steroidobacter sp.]MBL8268434.1 cell division protein FtsX [Steroidobacter sp.]